MPNSDSCVVIVRKESNDNLVIRAAVVDDSYRQMTITGHSDAEISRRLGLMPNVKDDPDKVVNSWAFTVNDEPCAIWDYKGSHHRNSFSAFGSFPALVAVFGPDHVRI